MAIISCPRENREIHEGIDVQKKSGLRGIACKVVVRSVSFRMSHVSDPLCFNGGPAIGACAVSFG